MARWIVAGSVVGVFALTMVLDWMDGPGQQPDVSLIAALAAVAGMALGFRPPWQGRNDKDGEG